MEKDFNEYELNYIKFNHQDDSANVYFKADGNGHYTIYAKPIQGSKTAYKFPSKDDNSAYFLVRELIDLSVGYSFEIRSTKTGKNTRIIATPKTNNATIKLIVEDRVLAAQFVKLLREQEVAITKKVEENKNRFAGTTLIRAKIGDLVKAEEAKNNEYANSLIDVLIDERMDDKEKIASLEEKNKKAKEFLNTAFNQTKHASNNVKKALNEL